jgi:hypothetical protein
MDVLQSKGYDTSEPIYRGVDDHHTSLHPKNNGLRKV